jgi:glycerol kinase
MPELLLALDAGTTGARAMLVDPAGMVVGLDKRPFTTAYPAPGLVEQDGAVVWEICRAVIAGALANAGRTIADVAAIGVTTQRASVVLWDRTTGEPVAPILIWSDLRGMEAYKALRAAGFISWPQVPSAKLPAAIALADRPVGDLCWGTLDSYLVHRLSGGVAHVTDASCAWMTGYFDYAGGNGWDGALIAHQNLPESLFPRLVESWGPIAMTDAATMGAAVPITALIADQQAGMVAHGALARGAWKATYGTSGVLMAGTGDAPLSPHTSMPAEALAFAGGRRRFCIEGMVITTGSLIEWLCGPLGLFASPAALAAAARSVLDTGGVVMRPSLQGMGAPHGRFAARGLIGGMSFATTPAHIARAALQAIAFRFRDIADLIAAVPGLDVPEALPVDGGLAESGTMLQLQADVLQRPVRRHAVREGTAYGAALAAGLGAGLIGESDLPDFARYDAEFMPAIGRDEADAGYAKWSATIGVEA